MLSLRARCLIVGWDNLSQQTSEALRIAIDDLKGDRERYSSWGLFLDDFSVGWALGIQVVVRDSEQKKLWSEAGNEIREQANIALQYALLAGKGWTLILSGRRPMPGSR